jgi:serine protease Do
LPIFGFILFTRPPGEKANIEVLRGNEKVSLEIPVVERPHNVDQLTDIVDPQKNLVPELGILALEISPRIAQIASDLRESSGVIVVAKSANSDWTENSLTTGDVIHALNGSPVTTIAGLESGLQKLMPGDTIVLQIERGQRLMYLTSQFE